MSGRSRGLYGLRRLSARSYADRIKHLILRSHHLRLSFEKGFAFDLGHLSRARLGTSRLLMEKEPLPRRLRMLDLERISRIMEPNERTQDTDRRITAPRLLENISELGFVVSVADPRREIVLVLVTIMSIRRFIHHLESRDEFSDRMDVSPIMECETVCV